MLSNIENRHREISKDIIIKLFQKYNISANWLLLGRGEMFNETEDDSDKAICNRFGGIIGELGLFTKEQLEKYDIDIKQLEKMIENDKKIPFSFLKLLYEVFNVNLNYIIANDKNKYITDTDISSDDYTKEICFLLNKYCSLNIKEKFKEMLLKIKEETENSENLLQ